MEITKNCAEYKLPFGGAVIPRSKQENSNKVEAAPTFVTSPVTKPNTSSKKECRDYVINLRLILKEHEAA